METFGLGLSVVMFLITYSISLLINDLLRFLISSWFSLCKLYVSRNLSMSSSCPVCWCIVFHSSLMILCICVVSVVISPLSFIILLIWVLFFFFFFLDTVFYLNVCLFFFFIFSNDQLLVLFTFSFVFLVSNSFFF